MIHRGVGAAVFGSGLPIGGTVHVRFPGRVPDPQTVDDDVNVNICRNDCDRPHGYTRWPDARRSCLDKTALPFPALYQQSIHDRDRLSDRN